MLVTIPALIMFIFFNRKIVEGMARVPSKAERVTEEDFRRYGCCSGDRSATSDGSVDDWLVHGSVALADVRKRNRLGYSKHLGSLSGEPRLEERERNLS